MLSNTRTVIENLQIMVISRDFNKSALKIVKELNRM